MKPSTKPKIIKKVFDAYAENFLKLKTKNKFPLLKIHIIYQAKPED